MLTNARRHRVCYEAAEKPLNFTSGTRLLFLRCTDIYHLSGDVSTLMSASKFDHSVAQLCCSTLDSRLAQFNVQPATPLELRVSLHRAMVSIAYSLVIFNVDYHFVDYIITSFTGNCFKILHIASWVTEEMYVHMLTTTSLYTYIEMGHLFTNDWFIHSAWCMVYGYSICRTVYLWVQNVNSISLKLYHLWYWYYDLWSCCHILGFCM